MNPEDALRRLRSAERWLPMEPDFLPAQSTESGSRDNRRRAHESRVRAVIITVVVLALLVVGTIALGQVTRTSAPALSVPPTATPTPSPSPGAGTVGALPAVAGTVLATWTSRDSLPATRTLDAHGKAVAITVACTGGGSVRYTLVHHSDSAIGCDGTASTGPELQAKNGRLMAEGKVTIKVSTTGYPRFALRVTAVPVRAVPAVPDHPSVTATGPGVPRSLRTCSTRDLEPTAEFTRWPHFEGGIVKITSAATNDCAIRTWPQIAYLDASGNQIGGLGGQNGDPATPAKPVRLAAHGTAYVEIELFRLDRLTDCGAERVQNVVLTIGRARTRIPVPDVPPVGKCADPNVSADGVGAVTGYRPTGP
ncbi:hypothetical protein [Amnibacterium setariae]|nr:hypothetical protein [Amnibacterium setariae]